MKIRMLFAIVVLLLAAGVGVVQAQGTTLVYDQETIGTFSDASPLNLYVFQGNAGDLVTVEVLPLAAGVEPTIAILNARQESIANSAGDIASAELGDAAAAAVLAETGLYTVLIGSETGATGDYLLRLYGTPIEDRGLLAADSPQQINFAAPGSVFYTLAHAGLAPTRINVDANNPAAVMRVLLLNSSGQVVSSGAGSNSLVVTLPPVEGIYRLVIIVVSSEADGVALPVSVSVSLGGTPPPVNQGNPGVVVTPEALPAGVGCVITPANAGGVNVRSGAGETFNVIGSLAAGSQVVPLAITTNGWYQINVNGVQGYVFSGVIIAAPDCASLPVVQAAAPPPQPTQPPAGQPTVTQPTGVQPTIAAPTVAGPTTVAPTVVPPTATTVAQTAVPPNATTAAQVAPTDSNYVLRVPLDGSISVSDFVSLPDGDVEDVVSYDVTGLNSNSALPGGRATLTITATCTGTGIENVRFVADGGQAFGCGQTVLTRIVNADSRTGAVRITATAGPGTFVQWTLTGTAPRLN